MTFEVGAPKNPSDCEMYCQWPWPVLSVLPSPATHLYRAWSVSPGGLVKLMRSFIQIREAVKWSPREKLCNLPELVGALALCPWPEHSPVVTMHSVFLCAYVSVCTATFGMSFMRLVLTLFCTLNSRETAWLGYIWMGKNDASILRTHSEQCSPNFSGHSTISDPPLSPVSKNKTDQHTRDAALHWYQISIGVFIHV